jgi:hypothetical protein
VQMNGIRCLFGCFLFIIFNCLAGIPLSLSHGPIVFQCFPKGPDPNNKKKKNLGSRREGYRADRKRLVGYSTVVLLKGASRPLHNLTRGRGLTALHWGTLLEPT